MNGWVSPRLKVRFEIEEVELQLYRPDGRRFATYAEIEARAERAIERASEERIRADRAETQAAIFASRLRELGVNPEELLARHRCAKGMPWCAVPVSGARRRSREDEEG